MPTVDLMLPRTCANRRPRRETLHPFAFAFVLLMRWIQRTRQRDALAGLDDRLLRDIGVTRVEAARECGKPFWR